MDLVATPTQDAEIVAVNRGQALVLLSTGETAPICTWLDCEGDECEPDDAVVAVAGPITGRTTLSFYAVELCDYDDMRSH